MKWQLQIDKDIHQIVIDRLTYPLSATFLFAPCQSVTVISFVNVLFYFIHIADDLEVYVG